MSNDFETINQLIRNGDVAEAISRLSQYVATDGSCAEAFFLLGKAYHKAGDWRQAIYNFNMSAELNPDGPAQEALKQLQDILNFYNTNLYNP